MYIVCLVAIMVGEPAPTSLEWCKILGFRQLLSGLTYLYTNYCQLIGHHNNNS